MRKTLTSIAVGALCAVANQGALAGAILSPTSVVSNDMGEYAVGDILTINNQSGLSVGFTSGVTDFATYLAGSPTHTDIYVGYEWFSAIGINSGTMVLDLGSQYSVANIALWNEEFSGIAAMDVKFSASTDFSGSASAGVFYPFNNPLGSGYGAEVFGVGASVGRYVQLTMRCPNPDYLYDGCSMGEIAFDVSAVPEPSTYALMLGGLALVGGLVRRARREQAR